MDARRSLIPHEGWQHSFRRKLCFAIKWTCCSLKTCIELLCIGQEHSIPERHSSLHFEHSLGTSMIACRWEHPDRNCARPDLLTLNLLHTGMIIHKFAWQSYSKQQCAAPQSLQAKHHRPHISCVCLQDRERSFGWLEVSADALSASGAAWGGGC